ncbi:DEAD/DEAH box helicase [Salininema proteolyticum]|uniref:DEAD/DEAH box helicase n=1 Tax=Salininema proteolyticum TaxID=1607685 RepID=UPI00362ABF6E
MGLYPTKFEDAYRLGWIGLVSTNDRMDVAGRRLHLRTGGLRLCERPTDIPPNSKSGWEELQKNWDRTSEPRPRTGDDGWPTRSQLGFLDGVEKVVDKERDLGKSALQSPCQYKSVESTGERRTGGESVYLFTLLQIGELKEGDLVEVYSRPPRRGRVERIRGRRATVAFEGTVDLEELPPHGRIGIRESSTVYWKKKEALKTLRDGASKHPNLLSAVADGEAPPALRSEVKPAADLDGDQLDAFQTALHTPIHLVQGPPGTGKTTTIKQIARTNALTYDRRVLITAHTNRAVDNIIADMPVELEIVRVGSQVNEDARPYHLSVRARELVEQSKAKVSSDLDRYRALDEAAGLADRLREDLASLGVAERAGRDAVSVHERLRGEVLGPLLAALDTARQSGAVAETAEKKAAKRRAAWDGWCHRFENLRAGWFGFLFILVLKLIRPRCDKAERNWRLALAEVESAAACTRRLESDCEQCERSDPRLRKSAEAVSHAEKAVGELVAAVEDVAEHTAECIRSLPDPLVGELSFTATGDHASCRRSVEALLDRFGAWEPLLSQRRALLGEWRSQIEPDSAKIQVELVRYAHVVGATCIGAATAPALEGLDFDVAIMDEAGQVSLPIAFVPLVKAEQAILVGDHMQLPPFADRGLLDWARKEGRETLGLVEKSALELLVSSLDPQLCTMLRTQRRMPPAVGSFISDSFYQGRLRTEYHGDHRDPLFSKALNFIDTSGLSTGRRFERPAAGGGWVNEAEADVLEELIAYYHRFEGRLTWAAITAYRGQQKVLRDRLYRRIGDTDLVDLNVGTVDSFQGGERDVIFYSFTRSNRENRVGFLKELRRANVALTRVQKRLVLTGDRRALENAADPGFQRLARRLFTHTETEGSVLAHTDVVRELRSRNGR